MAESTIMEKWKELFGAEGEPSSMPSAVAGINADENSTTRLVNSSLSPFRQFNSVLDDDWTASKPMPTRAAMREGDIDGGDIALLWSYFGQDGGLSSQTDVGIALNGTSPITNAGYGLSQTNKSNPLETKLVTGAGDEKTVRGQYRVGSATTIANYNAYTESAFTQNSMDDLLTDQERESADQ